MTDAALAIHDLVRIDPRLAQTWDAPSWVVAALARAPWVVVRRACAGSDIPVGVRGTTRAQRYAARIDERSVRERLAPADLIGRLDRHDPRATRLIAAARLVGAAAADANIAWGIAGAFGFELASNVPSTHAGSDLDIVVSADGAGAPFEPPALSALVAFARRCAQIEREAGVPVDAQVCFAGCGIALVELASGVSHVLGKTPDGPRLLPHPYLHVANR